MKVFDINIMITWDVWLKFCKFQIQTALWPWKIMSRLLKVGKCDKFPKIQDSPMNFWKFYEKIFPGSIITRKLKQLNSFKASTSVIGSRAVNATCIKTHFRGVHTITDKTYIWRRMKLFFTIHSPSILRSWSRLSTHKHTWRGQNV